MRNVTKKSKWNKSYCYHQSELEIHLQIDKKNLKMELDLSRMKKGAWNQPTKKMSKLLSEQYNIVFSAPDQIIRLLIKLPKDFFLHPQANSLSDIKMTRENIIGRCNKTYITKLFWTSWWISSISSQTTQ